MEGTAREAERERKYYALAAVFPLAVTFIDKSLGFLEKGDLARLNVLYSELVLLDHKSQAWVEGGLKKLRLDTWEFSNVVEKTIFSAMLICFVHAEVSFSTPYFKQLGVFGKLFIYSRGGVWAFLCACNEILQADVWAAFNDNA